MQMSLEEKSGLIIQKVRKINVKSHTSSLLFKIFKYVFLIDVGFVFFFPFLYMIITSLKSPADIANSTIKWIPMSLWFSNFSVAAAGLHFWDGLTNSIILTVFSTAGHLFSCALMGYALAKYKNNLTKLLMVFVIISIVVPLQVTVMPQYIVFAKLHWINTFLPIIVPSWLGFGLKGGLFVFIFRQFYTGIPNEIEEAARVDGCSAIKTFYKIIVPISMPPILVCTILSVVWHWNDSYLVSTFITDTNLSTITARLPNLYEILSSSNTSLDNMQLQLIYNEAVVMAATLLVVLPLLVFYFIIQRKFMEGVERSGIVG